MASLACQRLGSTLRQHHAQGTEGGKPAMVAMPLLRVQDAFFRNTAFLGFPPPPPPPPHTGGSAAASSAFPSPKCSTNSLHIIRDMANQEAPACTTDQEALLRLDVTSNPTCDKFKQTFLVAMADESSTPPAAASSSSSFSASDSDEDEEASSSLSSSCSDVCKSGPLESLSSLSEALPLKRGLSRFFSGKSQSFSSIAEVCSVGELAKPEKPFVKRRRTAAAGRCYSSFPPLPSGNVNHKKSKVRASATTTAPVIRTTSSTTKDNGPIYVLSLKCFSSPDLRFSS